MIILIDQDGPLADFEDAVRTGYEEFGGTKSSLVEYRDRKNFYVAEDYPKHLRSLVSSIYHAPGFFRNLKRIDGARDAILAMLEDGHDVRICTSPLTEYRHCVTEKFEWVERHFGLEFTKRIIITKDKTIVRGDYLIDDKPEIIGALRDPTWKHVVYDCPYNKNAKSKIRLTNWSEWKRVLLGC